MINRGVLAFALIFLFSIGFISAISFGDFFKDYNDFFTRFFGGGGESAPSFIEDSPKYEIESSCGNGIVEEGEECDDGNDWNYDECDDQCRPAGGDVCDYEISFGNPKCRPAILQISKLKELAV